MARVFGFATSDFRAGGFAGGRLRTRRQPRRWQRTSCTCCSRPVIPMPCRRRRRGGRWGRQSDGEPIVANRSYVFCGRVLCCFRVKRTSNWGAVAIGCRCGSAACRVEVIAGCWGSDHAFNETHDSRSRHAPAGRRTAACRGNASRRRLRHAQGGRRVLRLHRQLGGRQEYEHHSPAEAVVRCEDRKDRGGARQAGSVPDAGVAHGRRSTGFLRRNDCGNRPGNSCGK